MTSLGYFLILRLNWMFSSTVSQGKAEGSWKMKLRLCFLGSAGSPSMYIVPAGRLEELDQQVQEGRLSAAGRADDTDKFALHYVKGRVVEHQQIPKFLRQVPDGYFYFALHTIPPYLM